MQNQKHEMDELRIMFRSVICKLDEDKNGTQDDHNMSEGEYDSMDSYSIDAAMATQELSTVSSNSGGQSKRGPEETKNTIDLDEPPPTRRITMNSSSRNMIKIQKMRIQSQNEMVTTNKKNNNLKRSDHMKKCGQKSP